MLDRSGMLCSGDIERALWLEAQLERGNIDQTAWEDAISSLKKKSKNAILRFYNFYTLEKCFRDEKDAVKKLAIKIKIQEIFNEQPNDKGDQVIYHYLWARYVLVLDGSGPLSLMKNENNSENRLEIFNNLKMLAEKHQFALAYSLLFKLEKNPLYRDRANKLLKRNLNQINLPNYYLLFQDLPQPNLLDIITHYQLEIRKSLGRMIGDKMGIIRYEKEEPSRKIRVISPEEIDLFFKENKENIKKLEEKIQNHEILERDLIATIKDAKENKNTKKEILASKCLTQVKAVITQLRKNLEQLKEDAEQIQSFLLLNENLTILKDLMKSPAYLYKNGFEKTVEDVFNIDTIQINPAKEKTLGQVLHPRLFTYNKNPVRREFESITEEEMGDLLIQYQECLLPEDKKQYKHNANTTEVKNLILAVAMKISTPERIIKMDIDNAIANLRFDPEKKCQRHGRSQVYAKALELLIGNHISPPSTLLSENQKNIIEGIKLFRELETQKSHSTDFIFNKLSNLSNQEFQYYDDTDQNQVKDIQKISLGGLDVKKPLSFFFLNTTQNNYKNTLLKIKRKMLKTLPKDFLTLQEMITGLQLLRKAELEINGKMKKEGDEKKDTIYKELTDFKFAIQCIAKTYVEEKSSSLVEALLNESRDNSSIHPTQSMEESPNRNPLFQP